MKRIFSIILAAAFCLCLAACVQAARDDDLTDGGDTGGVTDGGGSGNTDGGGSGNTDGGGDADSAIQLTTVYGGKSVDLCDPLLREYLEEEDFQAQCDFLLEHEGENYDCQNIGFAWESDGSKKYIAYFADNEDFEDAVAVETTECSLSCGQFMPGVTYYWKVVGDDAKSASSIDSFYIVDEPIRFVELRGTANARDLGGWTTESGQRVRWGMLYRGGQLNGYNDAPTLSEEGIWQMTEWLGVKSEIDLRTPGADDADQTENYFNPGGPYLKAPITAYTALIPEYSKENPDRHFDERVPASFRALFEFLSDESNYPCYFHCNAGADRTGTLAFILNGVLGVSYGDLTRDFEVTSFSVMGIRWRGSAESGFTDGIMSDEYGHTYVAWGKMYELMMEYYGTESGKLSDTIENWLIAVCDVPQDQIQKFREIMLVG